MKLTNPQQYWKMYGQAQQTLIQAGVGNESEDNKALDELGEPVADLPSSNKKTSAPTAPASTAEDSPSNLKGWRSHLKKRMTESMNSTACGVGTVMQ